MTRIRIAAVSDLHGFLPDPDSLLGSDLVIVAGDICPIQAHSPAYRREWLERKFAPRLQAVSMALTGKPGSQNATIALGFGTTSSAALASAQASLGRGFDAVEHAYQSGWHQYLAGHPRPWSVAGHEELYDVSLMVLGASDDKTYRGAFIASPTMAWVWGQIPGYNGPYHLVWSRDLYEMATAEIAAGYRAAAGRALSYLWNRQQEPNGCFPQNSNVDGTPVWTGLQLDEVADPILLASQLGQTDAATWSHVQRAVGRILANGPVTQERWENEIGHSPSSIAAEIAGLVCAAQIAQDNGDAAAAAQYRAFADDWRSQLDHWTVTTNGPLSSSPYFLRLTVDGNADAGTTYTPTAAPPSISARSSTRASSSSYGLACCAPTTPRSSRPCPWSIASSASTPRTESSGTATTTTATGSRSPAGRSETTTASDACGRSSRASGASTNSPRVSCPGTSGQPERPR
jgi:hypothetical protein